MGLWLRPWGSGVRGSATSSLFTIGTYLLVSCTGIPQTSAELPSEGRWPVGSTAPSSKLVLDVSCTCGTSGAADGSLHDEGARDASDWEGSATEEDWVCDEVPARGST